MKNFKRLVAIALSVVMLCALSTVAFAEEITNAGRVNHSLTVKPATITQGTTTFTVDIIFADKRSPAYTVDTKVSNDFSYFMLPALPAGIKMTNATSNTVSSIDTSMAVSNGILMFKTADASLDANHPLLTLTFSCPADIAVNDYTLGAGSLLMLNPNNSSGPVNWGQDDTSLPNAKFLTVNAASDPTPAEIVSENVGFDNIETEDNTYYGVWIGNYVVNPHTEDVYGINLDFTDWTTGKVKIAEFPTKISGEGDVNCKIAIIGMPYAGYKAPEATPITEPIQ